MASATPGAFGKDVAALSKYIPFKEPPPHTPQGSIQISFLI